MNGLVPRILGLAVLLVVPWFVVGLTTRARSVWAGRRGPPLLQSWYDVVRLAQKSPVYSATTTPFFRLAPYVLLLSTALAAAVVPVFGSGAMVAFGADVVWFAYLLGVGRLAMVLAAFDTGSSFEGMGASREALFATLTEPALILIVGALCTMSHTTSLSAALAAPPSSGPGLVVWLASIVGLVVILQAEGGRVPVEDPTTHLELTMVREVMVLDHSGPELAAIQAAGALRLTLGALMLATLLNPWSGGESPWLGGAANLGITLGLALALGSVESWVSRLQLRVVPRYLLVAGAAGAVALIATTWQGAAS